MRSFVLKLVTLSILILPTTSFAKLNRFTGFENGDMGISVLLGQPTQARFVYWEDWKTQWNFGLGYDFNNFVDVEANYALYSYNARDIWKKNRVRNAFLFKYGPGVFVLGRLFGGGGGKSFRAGARAFTGLDYIFGGSRWALNGEIAGLVFAVGDEFLGFQGMVGVTFYFAPLGRRKKNEPNLREDDEFSEAPPPRKRKKRKKRRRRPTKKKLKDPNAWEGEEWDEKEAAPGDENLDEFL